MSIRIERILFALLLALWAVVLVTMLIPEVAGARGVVHPEIESIQQGGSGIERHGYALPLYWAFGVAVISTFVALIAFGARKGKEIKRLVWALLLGGSAFVITWTWLILVYRGYMTETSHALIFGFPVPTAVMIFVVYPISMIFNLLFVIGFKHWVLSDEAAEAYERMVAEKRLGQLRTTARGEPKTEHPGKAR
jgi:hypothetical protein